jgi:hypothetical protein
MPLLARFKSHRICFNSVSLFRPNYYDITRIYIVGCNDDDNNNNYCRKDLLFSCLYALNLQNQEDNIAVELNVPEFPKIFNYQKSSSTTILIPLLGSTQLVSSLAAISKLVTKIVKYHTAIYMSLVYW